MDDFKELLEDDLGTQALQQGAIITGKIVQIGESGVFVDIGAKSEGVLPLDQILPRDLPRLQVGDEIKVKVVKRVEGEYILSKRAVDYEEAWNRLVDAQRENQAIDITIENQAKNGYIARAFGVVEGFVHKSNFEAAPEINGAYKAFILDINRRERKLVFTRRAILKEEQERKLDEEFSRYQPGMVIEGTVESLTAYGAFIRISDSITGLLHISEMAWHQVKRPSDVVKKGEKVKVKILELDPDRKKISLSLKAATPDPLASLLPGEELEGKVESIADFGVFVRLNNHVTGLVHTSELSHKRFGHPSELYKQGDRVKVKVLNVDTESRRVGLSIKACEQDPWNEIHLKYQLGQVVEGTITQLLENGMVVKLDDIFEGFVPIGEISVDRIDHPKRKHHVDETVSVKIANIDTKRRRIRLSIKALLIEGEDIEVSTEPTGPTDTSPTAGKVTLGDLIDTSKLIIEEE
jgi:small subunit ribosomal protein S1